MTVIALSYDEPDALAAFAYHAGITFPLLSDPNSEVIECFGILNTLIPEDDHPWYGIPFPGVYVTDGKGVIQAKFFENHIAMRPGVDLLIRAALGEDVSADLTTDSPAPVEEVTVDLEIDDSPIPPGVVRELAVHLRVPEGQHLYGEPVPDGMVATVVEIDDQPSLLVLGTEAPATEPHTLATGETLQIYEGDVTLRVRFTHSGDPFVQRGMDETLPITGRVRYQSCDDARCGLPATKPFEISVPLARIVRTRFGNAKEGDMDSLPYLMAMRERRS